MAEKRFAAVRSAEVLPLEVSRGTAAKWVPRGPYSSTFGGWRFGNVAGRVSCLAKDFTNNILYVGSASGGIWKSTNDGGSWSSVFEKGGTQTIGAIALDPSDSKTIWVGTGENSSWCEEYFGIGILRSTDGGATWESRNGTGATTVADLSTVASIIVDPKDSEHIIVGGRWRGCTAGLYNAGAIYSSDDAGATWTVRLGNVPVTRIVSDPKSSKLLWAGGSDRGLYKSTNGGDTWTLQTSAPKGDVGRVDVAVAPSNGKYVYALFGSESSKAQLWRTTDGGARWSKMTAGRNACDGQCWYNMILAVHPTNPNIVYRGTIQLYKTTDGGAHWANLTGSWGAAQKVHQDTHALLIDRSSPDTFYVGCDGGVWKTADGGVNFTNLNSNLSLTQFYDIGVHPTSNDIIVGGAQDNSSLARTTGNTWALTEVTGDGFVSIINPVTTDTVYTASYPWDSGNGAQPSVLRSTNGIGGPYGWITDEGNGIPAGDRIGWVTPYTLDPRTPTTLFLGTHRIYRSTDSGSIWTQVGPADMTNGGQDDYLNSIVVASSNSQYVYAGTTDSRIWRSTDGGTNWSDISKGLPDGRVINDIAADPSDAGKAFCVLGGFGTAHLYEYKGGSWTARTGGLPDIPATTVLALNAKTIYVGTDVGVFKSTNRAVAFTQFNTGMPAGLVVTDLEYNTTTRTITAATYGRGAWQIQATAQ
ncbi:MAG: hypothetical protein HYX75_14190 [Acidobacteria bacterium]|nr:hypothetical protein [Acidobacteriota bacterium]